MRYGDGRSWGAGDYTQSLETTEWQEYHNNITNAITNFKKHTKNDSWMTCAWQWHWQWHLSVESWLPWMEHFAVPCGWPQVLRHAGYLTKSWLSLFLFFAPFFALFFWRSDRSFGDERASLPPMIGGRILRVAMIMVVEMIHEVSTEMHAIWRRCSLTENPAYMYDAHTYLFTWRRNTVANNTQARK